MQLRRAHLRAEVRRQMLAVDPDARRLTDGHARRFDGDNPYRVGVEQDVRRVRDRNQHERDEDDGRVDQVEPAEQPPALIDNRHTVSDLSESPACALSRFGAAGCRRAAASSDTKPSALIQPRYGATSARCRTSVPIFPLLTAMIAALMAV